MSNNAWSSDEERRRREQRLRALARQREDEGTDTEVTVSALPKGEWATGRPTRRWAWAVAGALVVAPWAAEAKERRADPGPGRT